MSYSTQPLRIGFCGNPKYLDGFIKLLKMNRHSFEVLDIKKPLEEQGAFDVLMHKIVAGSDGAKMLKNLQHYKHLYPTCLILDDPTSVSLLLDRRLTCEKLETMAVRHGVHVVQQPKTVVFDPTMTGPLPSIVKPFNADGSAESHQMALVHTQAGIQQIPEAFKSNSLILQEFINHDALLHKIYCMGDEVYIGQRPSLPNLTSHTEDLEFFGRISREKSDKPHVGKLPQMPSVEVVKKACQEIRVRLGIELFGIDMITKENSTEHYVIDVNYFPSYTGMDNASQLMFHFVLDKYEKHVDEYFHNKKNNPSNSKAMGA